ncbi:putative tRNA pseudouridine synthase Pus10 [Dissostichus eleginoides]|uniref:tRNA pseudouridine synthase Pus10 n=1 Tax=Dissostichus eleginoides TaxID=100907 RepID=A0AAD9C369_DISEL|nr:putative tRNA pseudouridine synthase Pus10 [Dissostichus eleginoides]
MEMERGGIRGHDLKQLSGCVGSPQIRKKNLEYIVQLTGTLWPLLLHNSRAASWSAMRRLGGPSLDQNRK